MPNRIIKETICTSATLEMLSWFEEVCFYRLIVQCDDFGRIDGRLPILHSRLFPLKPKLTNDKIRMAIATLEAVGLVESYEVAGRPYIQIVNWMRHQRVRSRRYKCPPPVELTEEEREQYGFDESVLPVVLD